MSRGRHRFHERVSLGVLDVRRECVGYRWTSSPDKRISDPRTARTMVCPLTSCTNPRDRHRHPRRSSTRVLEPRRRLRMNPRVYHRIPIPRPQVPPQHTHNPDDDDEPEPAEDKPDAADTRTTQPPAGCPRRDLLSVEGPDCWGTIELL